MRKHTTIDLDVELVHDAGEILGTTRTTDTIHAALAEIVRRRQRASLFATPNDLDLDLLDDIRAHRFAERVAPYGSTKPRSRRSKPG